MKNPLAKYREAGSFTAGLLIGISIVVPVIAMTVADYGVWQTVGLFAALVVLALGIALQVVVAVKPRHPRAAEPEFGVLPVGFVKLGHER